MKSYENLGNAVILQAVKDYRLALERLKREPPPGRAVNRAMECERFFRSKWFEVLTTVDGEYLIRKLREEAKDK